MDNTIVQHVRATVPERAGNRLFLAFLAVIGLRWLIDIGLPLLTYSPTLSDPTTGPAASRNPLLWGALGTTFFVACLAGARIGLWIPNVKNAEVTEDQGIRSVSDHIFHRALAGLTLAAATAVFMRMAYLLTSGVSLDSLARRAIFTDEALFTNPWLNLLSLIGDWATPLAVAMLLAGTPFRKTAFGALALVVSAGILTGGRGMALTPLVMWALLSVIWGHRAAGRRVQALVTSSVVAMFALMQIASNRFSTSFGGTLERTLLRPKRIDDLAFAADLHAAGMRVDFSEALIGSLTAGLPVGLFKGSRTVLAQVADQLPNVLIRTSGNSGTTLSGASEGYLIGGVVGLLLLGLALGILLGLVAQAASRFPNPIRMFVVVSVLILLFGASGSRTLATMGLVTVSVLLPLGILRMFVFELENDRAGRFLNVAAGMSLALGLAVFALANSKLASTGSLEMLGKLLVAAGAAVPVLVAIRWLVGKRYQEAKPRRSSPRGTHVVGHS